MLMPIRHPRIDDCCLKVLKTIPLKNTINTKSKKSIEQTSVLQFTRQKLPPSMFFMITIMLCVRLSFGQPHTVILYVLRTGRERKEKNIETVFNIIRHGTIASFTSDATFRISFRRFAV